MTYGLSITGFNQKRQPEILADLKQSIKDTFGDVGTGDDQLFGMLAGVFSEPVVDIWELLAAVYSSQYLTAEGVSLDYVAEFVSLVRISAQPSSVPVIFGGDAGSIVPIGTQVQLVDAGAILETIAQIVLDASNARRARLTVTEVHEDTTYQFTINGIYVGISTITPASEAEIAELLRLEIVGNSTVNALVSVTRNDATLEITIRNTNNAFAIAIDAGYLEISMIFGQAPTIAQIVGPTIIPLGSVAEIVTPVTGIDEVTNLVEGTQGRFQEFDPALRTRIVSNPNGPGKSTENAIKAGVIAAIDGVSAVTVYSNRLDFEDGEGRPPHSIEVIIQSLGGDDDEIAQAIYNNSPGGIQFVSSLDVPSTGTAIDVNGDPQVITFSRPQALRVWLWVDIETFSEETFPGNGTEQIAAALLTQGNESVVGIDIIVQKFFAAIYSVPGVANATIYMVVTDDLNPPKPSTPAENYVVAGAEIATYAAPRITVAVV